MLHFKMLVWMNSFAISQFRTFKVAMMVYSNRGIFHHVQQWMDKHYKRLTSLAKVCCYSKKNVYWAVDRTLNENGIFQYTVLRIINEIQCAFVSTSVLGFLYKRYFIDYWQTTMSMWINECFACVINCYRTGLKKGANCRTQRKTWNIF